METSNWLVVIGLAVIGLTATASVLVQRYDSWDDHAGATVLRDRSSIARWRALVVLLSLVVLGSLLPAARAEAVPLPDRMSAIGDSITRATNVCCWYGDHPGNSWSTGGAGWDGVRSHYERIRALNPLIRGNNNNDARAGARMAEAPAQAARAVEQRADYVTILMGANDACTSSPSTMTSVEDFRAQFASAIQTLQSGLPQAHIFVSSIPNVYRLWQIYKDSSVARFVWSTAKICQSMLSSSNTEQDRQAVLARVRAFNDVLATVCSQYARCRFDDNAVFQYQFERRHVSKLDFFHPSLSGQEALASLTWSKSWWSAGP